MSGMLPPRPHALEARLGCSSQWGVHHPAMTEPGLEPTKVLIIGDIRLRVTESEAAHHPITGHYRIETAGMQEPLYTFWHAEGEILCRQARSTGIAFDVRGARAGETRTYLVAVQVTESGVQGRVVQSGVFVQVTVTSDHLPTTF
jgi:hypothetical protein